MSSYPKVGDPVICRKTGERGKITEIHVNEGRPASKGWDYLVKWDNPELPLEISLTWEDGGNVRIPRRGPEPKLEEVFKRLS